MANIDGTRSIVHAKIILLRKFSETHGTVALVTAKLSYNGSVALRSQTGEPMMANRFADVT